MTAAPPESRLYRCSSCSRQARAPRGATAPCEFCGGELVPVWGLGQLAFRRPDPGPLPAEPIDRPGGPAGRTGSAPRPAADH